MVNDPVGKFKQLQAEAQVVLDEKGLARREDHELTPFQRFLHFWALVGKSFARNRCPVRASALAYASLLAMVPMLAVVFSVSSSLLKRQGEQPIEQFIERLVASVTPEAAADSFSPLGPELPDALRGEAAEPAPNAVPGGVAAGAGPGPAKDQHYAATRKQIAQSINRFVGNVQSGTLGVTGMIGLVVVAILMLSRIEDTFNDIWGVTRGRSWRVRVAQYWGAITLGPVFLALAVGLTSGPHFQATKDFLAHLPLGLGALAAIAFRFLPFVILILALSLLYLLMPNTVVHWRAALAGGIVAGTLWQLNNLMNVLYVSRVVKNSKIYGSLGLVPVFMVGLYVAWIILLFGAQVAYAYQNRRTYLQERQAEGVHQRSREFIALRLMAEIAARFMRAQRPASLTELAEAVGVPTRLAGQILRTLVEVRLAGEVVEAEGAYTPARPVSQITAQDILQALRAGQGLELSTRLEPMRAVVQTQFDRIAQAERAVASTVTLEGLVNSLNTPATA